MLLLCRQLRPLPCWNFDPGRCVELCVRVPSKASLGSFSPGGLFLLGKAFNVVLGDATVHIFVFAEIDGQIIVITEGSADTGFNDFSLGFNDFGFNDFSLGFNGIYGDAARAPVARPQVVDATKPGVRFVDNLAGPAARGRSGVPQGAFPPTWIGSPHLGLVDAIGDCFFFDSFIGDRFIGDRFVLHHWHLLRGNVGGVLPGLGPLAASSFFSAPAPARLGHLPVAGRGSLPERGIILDRRGARSSVVHHVVNVAVASKAVASLGNCAGVSAVASCG